MRSLIVTIMVVIAGCLVSGSVPAKDLVKQVTDGCATELEGFCSQVTPGNGRQLVPYMVSFFP